MALTLDKLTAEHWTVVQQPTAGGTLTWKVRLIDPARAIRYPWLIEQVLANASRPADEDDEMAKLEAASQKAREDLRPVEERDAEWMADIQDLAREVVTAGSDDGGETWRPVRLVATEAEQTDPKHPEDAALSVEERRPHPTEPMCLHVGFLDRLTLQAVGFAAVARLEGVAAAARRFRILQGGQHRQPAGPDGQGVRNPAG